MPTTFEQRPLILAPDCTKIRSKQKLAKNRKNHVLKEWYKNAIFVSLFRNKIYKTVSGMIVSKQNLRKVILVFRFQRNKKWNNCFFANLWIEISLPHDPHRIHLWLHLSLNPASAIRLLASFRFDALAPFK